MKNRWNFLWLQFPVTAHVLALVLAVVLGGVASETWRRTQESDFRAQLNAAALRHADELERANVRGAAMGMATLLGLNEPVLKELARGRRMPDDPLALQRMHVVRHLVGADGVYVINQQGLVVAHETDDPHVTGADFSFRPFWQMGMLGSSGAYPAVGHLSKKRGIYVTAPLYANNEPQGEVLGVVVVKLSADTLLHQLQREGQYSLLVSPQGVVFAATEPAWRFQLIAPLTAAELMRLKVLKQFGPDYSTGQMPPVLPFDVTQETVSIQGDRYFRARTTVQWSDPEGRWYLMVLAKSGAAVSVWQRWSLAVGVAATVFALLAALMRTSRETLARQQALAQNMRASQELADAAQQKAYQSAIILKLQDARTLSALADTFFQQLSTFAPVHRGALYVLSHDEVDPTGVQALTLAGAYGAQGAVQTMALGEGLTGQCALDRRTVVLRDIPPGAWRVSSGTGEAAPRTVMLLPITKQANLLGVVELASLDRALADQQPAFEALMPVLGMNLEVLLAEQRTERLLAHAQAMAQEYRQQQGRSQSMEDWYQSVLYEAPDGILVVDASGQIVLSNKLAQQLFGYSEVEMQGLRVERLIPTAMRQQHVQMREYWTQGAEPPRELKRWRSDIKGLRKDGTEVAVLISLSNIPATAFRGPCVCAVIRPQ